MRKLRPTEKKWLSQSYRPRHPHQPWPGWDTGGYFPPGNKTPRASGGRVRAPLIEKHEGLFLMKPDPLLRPSPTSEPHSGVLVQLHFKQEPFRAQIMPQAIHHGWAPWASEWPLSPGWGNLRPLHRLPAPVCPGLGYKRLTVSGTPT